MLLASALYIVLFGFFGALVFNAIGALVLNTLFLLLSVVERLHGYITMVCEADPLYCTYNNKFCNFQKLVIDGVVNSKFVEIVSKQIYYLFSLIYVVWIFFFLTFPLFGPLFWFPLFYPEAGNCPGSCR